MPTHLLLFVLLVISLPLRAAERPPNVVLIVADDLGWNELGCYGQKWIKTPHIDSIAKEGIRFTDFYSGNAVCATSRCSLMTGKHTGHAYIRTNRQPKNTPEMLALKKKYGWVYMGQEPIPADEITMAEVLKQKDYATMAAGKWGLGHFGTTGDPNTQGFDLFYGFNCQGHAHNHYPKHLWRNDEKIPQPGNDRTLYGKTYSQDGFTKTALDFIRENKDDPFFVFLPFAIPHLSIQVPQESLDEYTDVIPEEDYKHRGYLQHPKPRAGYAAMISHMDRDVGKVLSLLKELDLDDNTVVFFSSDNGPTYDRLGGSDSEFFESNGPMTGLKGSLKEGGIRVPMVARWPGHIPAGSVTDHPSAFWDLLPTIAELTGTKAPKDIDGMSFVPTLMGQDDEQKPRGFLYWEFPSYGGQQAVRMGKWKALREDLLRKNNKKPLKTQLYNLDEDIAEQHDVADQHPDILAKLEAIMEREHTPSKLFPIPAID